MKTINGFLKSLVKGRFSVIILSYKNVHFFKKCIDSVLKQDYEDIEIIFSDDGTPFFDKDAIVKYINENKRQNISNIIVESHNENVGTVRNINSALCLSSGEFIKCLAVDDALYDETVLRKASIFLNESKNGIIATKTFICNQDLLPKKQPKKNKQVLLNLKKPVRIFKLLCKKNFIDAVGIFETRHFFEKNGMFDEQFILLEDWPKWLELYANACEISYFDFISTKYRSDCGVATGINKTYLLDKKNAFRKYVTANKKQIGIFYYFYSKIIFMIYTSYFIRKMYSFFSRRS